MSELIHHGRSAMIAMVAREIIAGGVPADTDLAGLEDNLNLTLGLLQERPQAFMHMDSKSVTFGRTDTAESPFLSLIGVSEQQSCSLRLDDCNFVSLELDAADPSEPSERQSGPLDLPLGRNVYSASIGHEHRDQAVRRMLRPDEKLLVIGNPGIGSFSIAAFQSYSTVTDANADMALRKSAALQRTLDLLHKPDLLAN